MELRTKILAGYGLVLILVVIVCVWAVANLYQLGRASAAILRENYQSILAAENMINAIERQDSGLLLLMQGFQTEGLAQFRENEVGFLQWLSRAKDNITVEGEAELLQTIETEYLAYLMVAAELSQPTPNQTSPPSSYYYETVLPKFKQIREACTQLHTMNQQAMLSASKDAQDVSARAIWSMTILGVSVAGLGLVFSLFLSNILVRPLKEMTRATGRIAEGDYDVTIAATSKDEVGRLAQEIMTMSGKLKSYHELNVNRLLAEKRRSEAIIRSITDGLVVVDADFKIVAINPMAASILNTGLNQAEGKHFFDVIQNHELYEYMKTVAQTGQSPKLDEVESTLAIEYGEQTHHYRFAITPVKTQGDQMLGVVLLLQDVTKFKELNRLKSEFVMTASHELRTPLTSIAMSIGLLMENASVNLSENERELLQAAQEDVERLRALVNNLLDLSRIEAGRLELDLKPVSVLFLVEKAVSTLLAQIEEKNIELSQTIPADLPNVNADPNKVTWVITNLLANALRYTNRCGHIRVSAELVSEFVYVAVSDDGIGIPLEFQKKIFEKFVQVESGKSSGGSGLGLAICREIIKAHGGTIWVNSTPGQGSTFTFTLPLAHA
ncbi:MAG: HAMP domain-containing protein [Anaerolineae bacterium]|nr:HAMP domain-containing protein [Anaerolineae bacterium]